MILRSGAVATLVVAMGTLQGCATSPKSSNGVSDDAAQAPTGLLISEFILYPGDEINISVFPYEELGKQLTIPPGGNIVVPLLGEINANGKSLRELRELILSGLSEYRSTSLAPSDVVSITVYRHDDLARKFVIPPDGVIFFPLIGEIKIDGQSRLDLRQTIHERLKHYIVDPQVDVVLESSLKPKVVPNPDVGIEILKLGGQKLFVLGEVNNPGVFQADGDMGVVEAIARAGGFGPDAKRSSVLLIKSTSSEHETNAMTLDLRQSLTSATSAKMPNENIVLGRGDIVYVPRTAIANIARIADYLKRIIAPVVELERGIFLGQQIDQGPQDNQDNVPVR